MLTLLLLVSLGVQDPVRVNARLTQEEVPAGETTTLRVEVETGGPRARIGRFSRLPPGVELVSTRDFDQRQFSLPGGTRRFVTREFVLRAMAPGRYRIPALDVEVDGRAYSTRSLILTVSDAISRGGRGPGAGPGGEAAGGDVVLRGWLSTDTAWVGQQVTMNAEAMFSQAARLRLRRSPEYEAPSPSGFWIYELPPGRGTGTRMLDGRLYEVQGFRRAFFPLAPGEYEVPPARLEYEMRRGILYAPENFVLESDPLPLVVVPPPTEGRPEDYTGAVGRFMVRGWLEPAEVPAGEAAVLSLEVRGQGNMKSLPPPELPELEGVEVYPPAEESEESVADGVVRGVKRFSWVLIPRRRGDVSIPELRYPYFDPASERYEVAVAPAMTLRVGPGDPAATVAEQGADAEPVRYIRTRPSEPSLTWVRSPWFAGAQALPLLALLGALLLRRRRARGTTRSQLARQLRAGLRALEARADGDDPSFFSDLEGFARGWLGHRLGLRTGVAADRSRLAAAGVGEGTAAGIAALMDRLTAARYAPSPPPPSRRRELLDGARRLLERVHDEAPWPAEGPDQGGGSGPRGGAGLGGRGGRGGSAGGRTTVLLAAALASAGVPAWAGAAAAEITAQSAEAEDAVPAARDTASVASPEPGAPAVTSSPDAFARGVAAFDAGRYADAAARFREYLGATPGDATGWYNLGTAYHHAEQQGRAVWAWLHVPRLDPRDRDTRHNLRVAGAAPELVGRASPAIPLRGPELLLLASLAWFACGLAGAWWVLRRGRGAGAVALVALALTAASGAALLEAARTPDTLVVLEDTPLRAGPALRGDPLADLGAGDGLVPVSRRDEWLRVRTLDGREGWLETRSVGAIRP